MVCASEIACLFVCVLTNKYVPEQAAPNRTMYIRRKTRFLCCALCTDGLFGCVFVCVCLRRVKSRLLAVAQLATIYEFLCLQGVSVILFSIIFNQILLIRKIKPIKQ